MATEPGDNPAPSDDADEALFAQLEAYTEALQSGDREACERILKESPEIEPFLGCLGELNNFNVVRPARSLSDIEMPAYAPTLSGGSSSSFGSSMLKPNQTFGKFEIEEELGRGGMGVVFRARQTDLKRDVAIKVIRSHQLADDEELRRFQVEAQAAARLKHPNIVAVHEIGDVDGQHYFAMDYVTGETLSDRLKAGPLDVDEAASLLIPIAEAVHYLHGHQVMHRDLKPSNILLNEDGQPLVTDFGLARIYGNDEAQQTQTGVIIGTPSYMSPEQAAGRVKLITHRSDIYSLGAILYEMLTGQPPFKKDNPLDTIVQVIEQEPQLPRRLRPGLPRDLEKICLKCLEKDPDKRYATADEFAKDLDRYLRGEHVQAASPSIVNRVTRWARRFPASSSRWAGVFAVASIVQGRYWISGVESQPYHYEVMTILGVWAFVIGLFQYLASHSKLRYYLEYAWVAADSLLLTFVLLKVPEDLGPLVIGFPMVVVASGMFFNVRVVVCSTFFSCLGYVGLWLWHPTEPLLPHYGIIFLVTLGILGAVTAAQVRRVRVLNQYYESRL
ncbi:MAG: serine/threonine protein kinase [Planctomycetaceae bacterium]|nr:serine/threonine protein kinase [Planctomycetaceae bacterium]